MFFKADVQRNGERKRNVTLGWCYQNIMNQPCGERVMTGLKTFPTLFIVPASDSGQSREGWLIVLQSLSNPPDKETLDYTQGSRCWIHTLPSRERGIIKRPSPGFAPPGRLPLVTCVLAFTFVPSNLQKNYSENTTRLFIITKNSNRLFPRSKTTVRWLRRWRQLVNTLSSARKRADHFQIKSSGVF